MSAVTSTSSEPQGLCARFASHAVNCVKSVGSIANARVLSPASSLGVGAITRLIFKYSFNPFNQLTESEIRENTEVGLKNLVKNYKFTQFDIEKVLNSNCYYDEVTNQINLNFLSVPSQQVTPLMMKTIILLDRGVVRPIFEELIFRFGLNLGICDLIEEKCPEWKPALNSTLGKVARIVLNSALFSAVHSLNGGQFSDSFIQGQIVDALVTGIVTGVLHESKAGLIGSIGAHMAGNIVSLDIWKC